MKNILDPLFFVCFLNKRYILKVYAAIYCAIISVHVFLVFEFLEDFYITFVFINAYTIADKIFYFLSPFDWRPGQLGLLNTPPQCVSWLCH